MIRNWRWTEYSVCLSCTDWADVDLARLSLNSITLKSLSLSQLVVACERRDVPALAPWRQLLPDNDVRSAAKALHRAGLTVSSLCRGGMFTAADDHGRKLAIADNRRAIEQAHALNARCLVIVVGPVVGTDLAGSRAMVRDGLGAVLADAQSAGVRLAIEPLHPMLAADRSVVCRLDEALDLCEELTPTAVTGTRDQLGVIVDAYHVWWDAGLEAAIARAGSRIAGVHVSDWVSPLTGELASGRGMMGDGVIDLPQLVGWCDLVGYTGPVEVEILSDHWWSLPADRVLDTVIDRFTTNV
jgi:sugar phosphate isomerase/epimerase